MQSRLALRYLDWGLRNKTGQGYREWVAAKRPEASWYQVALELSRLTGVDASPETVRRWFENPL
jgi:hypothetical protein